jgi:N-acetylmuramoyl-L-alanine amidase
MNIVKLPLSGGSKTLEPSRVVVHCMAEYIKHEGRVYHGIEWLRKKGLSAHIFVTPSGVVIRSREDDQGAWHAKALEHNRLALGIEFLVPGAHDWGSFKAAIETEYLTDVQYAAGVEFCREEWVEKLGLLHYVKHSTIDPVNKTDPGEGFPWARFLGDIGVMPKLN